MEDQVPLFLVMIAGLFLLGAVGEVIFARTQIPDVVWLIGAGIILRVSGLVDPAALNDIQPLFAAVTLIVVLFDGGSKLVLNELVKSAPRASILAVLSFVSALLVVACLTMLASLVGLLGDDWTWSHGLMVGAILGGSSSLIIMPSMQLAKVEQKVANLVSLESALTDALCVVVTVAMIGIVVKGQASASESAIVLAKSFGIALGIGIVFGWTWFPVLRVLQGSPHAYPVTLAALILLYVIVDRAGGSAAMGILAFSVLVGNADALMKKVGFSMGLKPLALDDTVVTTHTQVTFIIKTFFFTFIGLMLGEPISLLLFGVVIGIILLVARVPVVKIAIRGAGFSPADTKMINVSLPRGMAAGVLATMPAQAGVAGTEDLPTLVFSAVVTSILVFAVGFKRARAAQPQPQAQVPPGSAPPEQVPPGSAPPEQMPPGTLPPQQMPPGTLPPQQMPPGTLPPQQMPPGTLPPQQMPPGTVPPEAMPPGPTVPQPQPMQPPPQQPVPQTQPYPQQAPPAPQPDAPQAYPQPVTAPAPAPAPAAPPQPDAPQQWTQPTTQPSPAPTAPPGVPPGPGQGPNDPSQGQ